MATPPRKQKSNLLKSFESQKWVTLIALPILVIATVNSIYWIWGLLFVFWGLQSISNRQVFLLEEIHRDEDPVLYWLITALWIGSGLLYLQASFLLTL